MTSQESFRTDLPAGHWFENVAPLGEKPDWRIVPIPAETPNLLRVDTLLGEPADQFLRRQYK